MFRQSSKILSNSSLKETLSLLTFRNYACGMKQVCAEEVIRMDEIFDQQPKKKCGKLCPLDVGTPCDVKVQTCKKGRVPPTCVKKSKLKHFVKRENPTLSFSEMLFLIRKKCT